MKAILMVALMLAVVSQPVLAQQALSLPVQRSPAAHPPNPPSYADTESESGVYVLKIMYTVTGEGRGTFELNSESKTERCGASQTNPDKCRNRGEWWWQRDINFAGAASVMNGFSFCSREDIGGNAGKVTCKHNGHYIGKTPIPSD